MTEKKQTITRELKRIAEYTGYSISDIRAIADDLSIRTEYDPDVKRWMLRTGIPETHRFIQHLEELKTLRSENSEN